MNYRYVAEELRYLLVDSSAQAIVYHSTFAPTLAEVLPELRCRPCSSRLRTAAATRFSPVPSGMKRLWRRPQRQNWNVRPTTSPSSTWAARPGRPRVCYHRGGTVYIQDTPERLVPGEIWDLVEQERITLLLIVGDAFARPLLDEIRAHPRDGSSLTTLLSGGAAMSAGVKQRFLELFPH